MEVDQGSGAAGGSSAHAREGQSGGGGGGGGAAAAASAAPVPYGDGTSAGEVLGLGRPAVLFSRQALEEALSAAAG